MASLSKPQHQRYTDEKALSRMAQGRCPECGGWPIDHTGWGTARCSLTDNGVAGRLWQYQKDQKEAGG